MKVLVLGASGGVGQHVVRIAHARGHEVTAYSRTPLTVPDGVRLVIDDVLRDGSLPPVVAGQDAVLSSLGIRRKGPRNPWSALASPPDFSSASAQRLVDAMKQHGVRRVIAVSAAGVGDSAPGLNWLMRFFLAYSNIGAGYRDLEKLEASYAASGLDWCCVRPTTLTNGPETKRVVQLGDYPLTARIARADVAHWMVEHLDRDLSALRTPIISGG